ncbi:MAG: sterol desaturase family protein [Myxococcaceae bacterium]|nr:sterol desaturase family protein [Myxococcaceae bacterium]
MGLNLIALAIPLFFVGIGVELALARRRGLSVYRLGDAISDMGCGVLNQLVSNLLGGAVLLAAYEALFTHRLFDLPTTWLPWVAALLGVEFAYYWWHRLSHEVNLLWAAHVVHHHSEDYNLAVALRQSVTTWVTTLPFYLPLALLGVPTLPFAVMLGLSTLYQFWIHTELVPPLGFLEKWLNTPSLHRVHHAINPQYLDKNHGATFSVFDRLFGTYAPEVEPCVYGTTTPLKSFNPLWAQVERYVELLRLARLAPTVRDALKVFVASPAWRPGWMGEATRRDPLVKYDVEASRGVRRYVFWQCLVLLVATFGFLMWGVALLPMPWKLLAASWLAVSATTIPGLLEGRSWARPLEAARWVGALAGVATMTLTAT